MGGGIESQIGTYTRNFSLTSFTLTNFICPSVSEFSGEIDNFYYTGEQVKLIKEKLLKNCSSGAEIRAKNVYIVRILNINAVSRISYPSQTFLLRVNSSSRSTRNIAARLATATLLRIKFCCGLSCTHLLLVFPCSFLDCQPDSDGGRGYGSIRTYRL